MKFCKCDLYVAFSCLQKPYCSISRNACASFLADKTNFILLKTSCSGVISEVNNSSETCGFSFSKFNL